MVFSLLPKCWLQRTYFLGTGQRFVNHTHCPQGGREAAQLTRRGTRLPHWACFPEMRPKGPLSPGPVSLFWFNLQVSGLLPVTLIRIKWPEIRHKALVFIHWQGPEQVCLISSLSLIPQIAFSLEHVIVFSTLQSPSMSALHVRESQKIVNKWNGPVREEAYW
jgi:hypothetical protein